MLNCEYDYTKSYQYIDFLWALNQNRAIFGHKCGLGKTWFIVALIEHLRYYKKIDKALVLTSPVGIYNLKNEFLKLGSNQIDSEILTIGSISDIKDRAVFESNKKTIIMSYDSFRRISDFYKKTRKSKINFDKFKNNFDMAIFLDECHLIGNPTSKRAKSFCSHIHNFKYRYLFSGTFADKYEKLYIPLKIVDPILTNGLSYNTWLKQYCTLGNSFSKYAINQNSWDLKKLDELNQKLYSKYARKRGIECLDVPPQYVKPPILVQMNSSHRKIYEAFSYFVMNNVVDKTDKNYYGVTANLTNSFQFAQLCCDNPSLLLHNDHFKDFSPELQKDVQNFDYEKNYSKLKVLDDIIETHCDEQNEKIIVWYYHPLTMEALKKYYEKRTPVIIHSGLDKQERISEIERFKKNNSKIAIMSIASASTSITVVEAKAMVFYETSWVYNDYEQASGRIQRPGQDQSTVVYNIRFENSLDCLQLENLQTKGEVVSSLLRKQSLTHDDWKKVFNSSMNLLNI